MDRSSKELKGIPISSVGQLAWSDDGEHVFVEFINRDGAKQGYVFPYDVLGQLTALLTKGASEAYNVRVTRNPIEALERAPGSVVPAKEIALGTSAEHEGPILTITTADNIPFTVEVPWPLAREFSDLLGDALDQIEAGVPPPPGSKPN